MKQIIFLLCILTGFTSFAQTFNKKSVPTTQTAAVARGYYGTYVAIGASSGNLCTINTGTVTPITKDTLVVPAAGSGGAGTVAGGTDTGYVQFSYLSKTGKIFDLQVTKLTGTLAGSAILQGSLDNSTWYTLTGNTTYCTSCISASATLTGAGTTDYQWNIPENSGDIFPYHQIRVITTGTSTAVFTGSQLTAY